MKTAKITYWATTIIISAMMMLSVVMYLTSAQAAEGFAHLGFPGYFRVELAIAKFMGVIALLLPAAKGRIKEWAYFGFFITFVSAFIAHFSAGDPAGKWVTVLVMTGILIASYLSYHKLDARVFV